MYLDTPYFLQLRTSTLLQLWNLNSLYAELPERPWEAQNLNSDAMAWQKDSNWAHLLWKSFRRAKDILWDASPV